ncbi:hypothetical protein [Agrobacterium rosae]|uniref:TonB C-terminal domain-containing protein n=2 Tax=Agrobacterium rosae TaxID=1972867 RepID=A0AAE5RWE9_9HYPH|nr:hypothetical protein [Agrobacterium rosae]KAA3509950.1 hypothetical protein DXM21_19015 [Agrobacterium rosae]KAA3515104.1 hypothetical protein DXM25_21355 [Agrobacterium rosae]MCM2433164.1 hypothetical protein [Agrobacterium rosae]MQB50549.1 hypothetical protein [Agrobacterium rosae]POO50874.1 hypothetical protein CPJ18_15245 [Agrobacterium rosae]
MPLLAFIFMTVFTTVAAIAAPSAQDQDVISWKRQLASELVPIINKPELKELATGELQMLYVRFRIDGKGKAQSISFTENTKARPESKVAVYHLIEETNFPVPPAAIAGEWLILPLSIQPKVAGENGSD